MLKEGVSVEVSEQFQSYHEKVNLNKWDQKEKEWFLKEIHILKEIGAIEPCVSCQKMAKDDLSSKNIQP